MAERMATLQVDGKPVTLPVREGSLGPAVVDIRNLYANTDLFTFDPGFTSTASCESKITFIDGDEGVLLYRGYPIDQLAENGDFLDLAGENRRIPSPQVYTINQKTCKDCSRRVSAP